MHELQPRCASAFTWGWQGQISSDPYRSMLLTVDIPTFIRMYPPFDELNGERIDELVAHLRAEFHPAGEVILQQAGEPAGFLYMARTGAGELIDDHHDRPGQLGDASSDDEQP